MADANWSSFPLSSGFWSRVASVVAAAAVGWVVGLAPVFGQDYPEAPIVIPDTVDAALSEIGKQLEGAEGIESVVVVTTDGATSSFASAKVAAAVKQFSFDENLLAIPVDSGDPNNPKWTTDYVEIRVKYKMSPGTSLDCGNKAGGRRNCTQY
jgi:hypothetical protein